MSNSTTQSLEGSSGLLENGLGHAAPVAKGPPARRGLISRTDARALKPENQRIAPEARPGWLTGEECLPNVGDAVYCVGGVATVLKVLGKTGNGSRLLELRLATGVRDSFFAAASNVLVAPPDAVEPALSSTTMIGVPPEDVDTSL